MKLAEDLIRLLADEIKQIPKKYIYIWLVVYYGLSAAASVIYLVDWLIKGGTRAELLQLIDKL